MNVTYIVMNDRISSTVYIKVVKCSSSAMKNYPVQIGRCLIQIGDLTAKR